MYRPLIYPKTGDFKCADAGTAGWFIMVPAAKPSADSTMRMHNSEDNSGPRLFYQNYEHTGQVYGPGQVKPLPYTNGLYLELGANSPAATVYVWPGETYFQGGGSGVYRPKIDYETSSGTIQTASGKTKGGWFIVVPASIQGGAAAITVYNDNAGTGDILFYQNGTTGNVYSPNQPIPLPYTNGVYLKLANIDATIYTWPGETTMPSF